jgi:hypothetical protein
LIIPCARPPPGCALTAQAAASQDAAKSPGV